ncbi:MAG: hypothetical protein JWM05_1834 [Acidimicrobiales bacterium]|nr:hypothetical protein [Acidimicrobiales bacterium]
MTITSLPQIPSSRTARAPRAVRNLPARPPVEHLWSHPGATRRRLDPADRREHVAAVMFPLSESEQHRISDDLGAGWTLVDGRRADHPDAVLLPPCSRQTTAALRARFPDAQLIVVDSPTDLSEADHLALGPIARTLEAGADVYVADVHGAALSCQRTAIGPGRPPPTRDQVRRELVAAFDRTTIGAVA